MTKWSAVGLAGGGVVGTLKLRTLKRKGPRRPEAVTHGIFVRAMDLEGNTILEEKIDEVVIRASVGNSSKTFRALCEMLPGDDFVRMVVKDGVCKLIKPDGSVEPRLAAFARQKIVVR